MNWSDFFHMGGYAFFVWSSYGLTLAVVVWNIVAPIKRRKTIISQVKRAIKREQLRSTN